MDQQQTGNNKCTTGVLLVVVNNIENKIINQETYHKVFSAYGEVWRLLIFERSPKCKAFVEMDSIENAQRSLDALNNQELLTGFKMNIYPSNLIKIVFQENNPGGFDYTVIMKQIMMGNSQNSDKQGSSISGLEGKPTSSHRLENSANSQEASINKSFGNNNETRSSSKIQSQQLQSQIQQSQQQQQINLQNQFTLPQNNLYMNNQNPISSYDLMSNQIPPMYVNQSGIPPITNSPQIPLMPTQQMNLNHPQQYPQMQWPMMPTQQPNQFMQYPPVGMNYPPYQQNMYPGIQQPINSMANYSMQQNQNVQKWPLNQMNMKHQPNQNQGMQGGFPVMNSGGMNYPQYNMPYNQMGGFNNNNNSNNNNNNNFDLNHCFNQLNLNVKSKDYNPMMNVSLQQQQQQIQQQQYQQQQKQSQSKKSKSKSSSQKTSQIDSKKNNDPLTILGVLQTSSDYSEKEEENNHLQNILDDTSNVEEQKVSHHTNQNSQGLNNITDSNIKKNQSFENANFSFNNTMQNQQQQQQQQQFSMFGFPQPQINPKMNSNDQNMLLIQQQQQMYLQQQQLQAHSQQGYYFQPQQAQQQQHNFMPFNNNFMPQIGNSNMAGYMGNNEMFNQGNNMQNFQNNNRMMPNQMLLNMNMMNFSNQNSNQINSMNSLNFSQNNSQINNNNSNHNINSQINNNQGTMFQPPFVNNQKTIEKIEKQPHQDKKDKDDDKSSLNSSIGMAAFNSQNTSQNIESQSLNDETGGSNGASFFLFNNYSNNNNNNNNNTTNINNNMNQGSSQSLNSVNGGNAIHRKTNSSSNNLNGNTCGGNISSSSNHNLQILSNYSFLANNEINPGMNIGDYVNPQFIKSLRRSKVIYANWFDKTKVTLKMLINIFSYFGPIEKIMYLKNKSSCLVEYTKIESASAAKEGLNDMTFMDQEIKIFYSNYDQIYIKNLKKDQNASSTTGTSEDNDEYYVNNSSNKKSELMTKTINPPSECIIITGLNRQACNIDILSNFLQNVPILRSKFIIEEAQNICILKLPNREKALLAISLYNGEEICGKKVYIGFSKSKFQETAAHNLNEINDNNESTIASISNIS